MIDMWTCMAVYALIGIALTSYVLFMDATWKDIPNSELEAAMFLAVIFVFGSVGWPGLWWMTFEEGK